MTVDPAVLPGLLLLAAEIGVLAAVGFVIARVALRQTDDRMALAQGLVVGPALWGLIVNVVMHAVPGLAGAIVGWGITLALGAGLALRAPASLRLRGRTLAGFAIGVVALFWAALTSRQLLGIPDVEIHLGLAASIRAGGFPPELPWNPGLSAPYHYGIDLLISLLTPPVGPDLAFVTELLGAYIWMSFALLVITTLIQRSSWLVALPLAPLLLTAGAWTLLHVPPWDILQIPVPAGLPSAGLRASLADIYWPAVELPWAWEFEALPNLFRPPYVLAYALAFVVLERAARAGRRSWLSTLTLAGLVGSGSLLSTTVAPVVLVLWVALEAAAFWTSRHAHTDNRRAAVRGAAGPALAALLLTVGGGVLTRVLTGGGESGLALGWIDDPGSQRPLAFLDLRSGGVGLLGLGPLVVVAAAVLLARRDRLVLALGAGGGLFLLASLTLNYEFAQHDVTRLVGHARNFALLALLVALSSRLHALQPRWRYAAAALVIALITWPTVAEPARNLGLAIGHGVDFANAWSAQQEPGTRSRARSALKPFTSERIAAYIRDHTAVDARILSPHPHSMSFATGRPNAAGFVQSLHYFYASGPEYRDAVHYLEPTAIRQLGIAYVHATDAWLAELPDRARRWLADPDLFELLIRDGTEALYRVRPEFLRLDATPEAASFQALRQAVPSSAVVYLSPTIRTLDIHRPEIGAEYSLQVASSLSHARLLGVVDQTRLHLLAPLDIDPLGQEVPDLVVVPATFVPWMFPPAGRQPIWWNDRIAVYAPDGTVATIMPSWPVPWEEPLAVSVRASDVRAADGRITFTTTLNDRAPEQWAGQDWVLIAVDTSPWALPLTLRPDGLTPVADAWFAGQAVPGAGTTTHTYEFDANASRLAVRDRNGTFTTAVSSGRVQVSGVWTLGIRLQHEWRPNSWREVAFIPVLRIEVSEAGEVSYEVFDAVLDGSLP